MVGHYGSKTNCCPMNLFAHRRPGTPQPGFLLRPYSPSLLAHTCPSFPRRRESRAGRGLCSHCLGSRLRDLATTQHHKSGGPASNYPHRQMPRRRDEPCKGRRNKAQGGAKRNPGKAHKEKAPTGGGGTGTYCTQTPHVSVAPVRGLNRLTSRYPGFLLRRHPGLYSAASFGGLTPAARAAESTADAVGRGERLARTSSAGRCQNEKSWARISRCRS
jgi:hypothetical protein